MATSSDATTAATSADAHAATTTSAGSAGDSETDPYAYTYADRPGEWYAPYTVLFANTAADLVPEHWVARYEREAAKNWDKFYLRHGSTFFRDRHYLGKEWSELDGAGGAASSAAAAAPAAAADDADGDGGELERHIAEADGELGRHRHRQVARRDRDPTRRVQCGVPRVLAAQPDRHLRIVDAKRRELW